MITMPMRHRAMPPIWQWILVLAVTTLCLRLSLWQWHRAQFKASLIATQLAQHDHITQLDKTVVVQPFQRLAVRGHYRQQQWWLDNRFYQHQPGFEVLGIFQVNEDTALLVDRGWVTYGKHTRIPLQFPSLVPAGSIHGQAYFPGHQWQLGSAVQYTTDGVPIVERLAIDELSKLLSLKLFPFVLRLADDDANALPREWPVVTMSPARHKGYALQWLAFALTAVVLFFTLGFKRSSAGTLHD